MTGDAARSVEVERSYDVADDTALPHWVQIDAVSVIGAAEVRELDARYFDTDDLALAAASVALRRRTGGPDAGWHVKVTTAEGREEWQWPLGDDAEPPMVPDAVARAITQWATPPFHPLARIRNTRTAYALCTTTGQVVAEFADDRVRATAERTGAVKQWREWEVELGPGAPDDPLQRDAFFASVEQLVAGVGGRPAASDSKLRRTLDG